MKGACLMFAAVSALLATTPDKRLATARTAIVLPVNELADDKPVSACVAERLQRATPLTLATGDSADVLLRISATIRKMETAGDGAKFYFTRHSAIVTASLPDGTVLWTDKVVTGRLRSNVECKLADEVLAHLREAMRKARDAKK